MLKLAGFFLIVVAFLTFNVQLSLDRQSFLLFESVSPDGWRHSCLYYKPFTGTVTVTRPIQLNCPRYDALS